MSNVSEWSVTAGSNNSSPPNGWPEGMARSAVNDAAREMMAALAKWYQDSIGTLALAGGTTAYTLTTNNAHTALSDIPMMAVRVNAANTGAMTLAVDGLTAKSVVKLGGSAMASGDLAANQLIIIVYNPNQDRFEVLSPGQGQFASGTAMVFYQASVPTGWSAVAQNNKALRVVTNGTTGGTAGGTTAFTSVFTSRTIAQANLPNVNFSHSLSVGTSITNGTNVVRNLATQGIDDTGGGTFGVDSSDSSTLSLASGTVSGTVSSGGSGTAMDFAVQYIDIIVGTKN